MNDEDWGGMPHKNGNVVMFPNERLAKQNKNYLFEKESATRSEIKEMFSPPPWLFQHADLNNVLASAKPIDEKTLKNKLNHAHFIERRLSILLRHTKYQQHVVVAVATGPCFGGELTCWFVHDGFGQIDLKKFEFLHLIIDDGYSVILVPATPHKIGNERFSLRLPEKAFAVGERQTRRYSSKRVDVELFQESLPVKGELLDFSPEGFRVRCHRRNFRRIDGSRVLNHSFMVHLRRYRKLLFSGLCRCIRLQEAADFSEMVLAPPESRAESFPNQESEKRLSNIPLTPSVVFEHPLFRKNIELDVADISTSGFSVFEKRKESVLMQGLIISDLRIVFASSLEMQCSAMVNRRFQRDERKVRCDFAILDMDIDSYTRLVHILANSRDSCCRISKKVDMDALWEFFFETGFIYPKKYSLIQSQKEQFKRTYQGLYNNDPEIARHFVYQRDGRLLAHISMIRAYNRAWLIQHHAARSAAGRRAGFAVLKQVVMYLNDMHRLPSAKLDHMMVYFRPENSFPAKVFGGFVDAEENIGACSTDLFCYLPCSVSSFKDRLPLGWSVEPCTSMNLWELDLFYQNISGGLFVDALGLSRKSGIEEPFQEAYERLGFLRKWKAYSLNHQKELQAVLIVNQSDFGFNLSELINGIKVLIINPEKLSWPILSSAIGDLLRENQMKDVSLMFFPSEYAEEMDVPYQKKYQLWVYDARFVNQFVKYMKREFRIKDWWK